jgi:hypothetical protein
MKVSRLLVAVSRGMISQIPGFGPVFEEVMREMDRDQQQEFQRRLKSEINLGKSTEIKQLIEKYPLALVRFILSALKNTDSMPPGCGERPRGLHHADPSQARRFLYLASKNYAGAERTCEIATDYGFLWRSYYANVKNAARLQSIPNVSTVTENAIIVLGYRHNRGIRILLPLVVQPARTNNANAQPIPAGVPTQMPGEGQHGASGQRDHAPFVWAKMELAQVLRDEGYLEDPRLHHQTGLNVLPLSVNLDDHETRSIFETTFPSPGHISLWHHDDEKIDPRLRNWIRCI